LLSSGFQRTADYLPLPKWRRKAARPSLLDLLNLLRHQIFARGVDAPVVNFDDFASAAIPPGAKSSKLPLAAETLATIAAWAHSEWLASPNCLLDLANLQAQALACEKLKRLF
jgi:hypothetical protein